jgi:hypothetical protein
MDMTKPQIGGGTRAKGGLQAHKQWDRATIVIVKGLLLLVSAATLMLLSPEHGLIFPRVPAAFRECLLQAGG